MRPLTANELLKISKPENLFSGPDAIATEYRELAKIWHPDKAGGNNDVFAHINELHTAALQKAEHWNFNLFEFATKEGKTFKVKYLKDFSFELGRAFICNSWIIYQIDKEHADLVKNSQKVISNFSFPNDRFREGMEHYLPKIDQVYETDQYFIIKMHKPNDVIRLRDVVEYYGEKLDPKHVAWILSTLYNFCCYLEWSKLTHNDLSFDSFFICPEKHGGCILGGWWYATSVGEQMTFLPSRTIAYAPHSVITSKKASFKVDLGLTRLLGLEMLGDETGGKLIKDKSIPESLLNWLRYSASDSAKKDYRIWQDQILIESFGKRRFFPMDLKPSDIQ